MIVPTANTTGWDVLGGIFGGGNLLEDRRQSDADGAADRVDGRSWCGAQKGMTAILFDFDLAEVGEVVDDTLPLDTLDATGGEAVKQLFAQHQGEEGDEDVAADGGVGLMIDGAGGEQAFAALKVSSTASKFR